MTERNGYHYHEQQESEEEDFLTDSLDHEILMHRDAHFGGSFDVMLDYYEAEKVGAHPDFELDRIEYLAAIEKETGKNLAPLLLTGPEAEAVAKARSTYQDFKKIYASNNPDIRRPRLIADLILSEEEEPTAEVEAIVEEGAAIVPDLIAIVKSEEAYDTLFPGYGFAPGLAIHCLGKIKDPSAIIPIFETLGRETAFGDEAALDALRDIGQPAQDFLLKRIGGRPLTKDNTTAAYALTAFPPEPAIAKACFEELKDPVVRVNTLLSSYLLVQCEELEDKEAFIALSKAEGLPRDLKIEMERIIRLWGK